MTLYEHFFFKEIYTIYISHAPFVCVTSSRHGPSRAQFPGRSSCSTMVLRLPSSAPGTTSLSVFKSAPRPRAAARTTPATTTPPVPPPSPSLAAFELVGLDSKSVFGCCRDRGGGAIVTCCGLMGSNQVNHSIHIFETTSIIRVRAREKERKREREEERERESKRKIDR